MNGYVEAGYAAIGITLSGYAVWILLRSRSVARAVRPGRGDEPAAGARRRWP